MTSWEQAPRPPHGRRWLRPAAAAAVVAVAAGVVLARQAPSGTLAVGPSASPSAAPSPSFDPADFAPRAIGQQTTAPERAGDGPLLAQASGVVVITSDEREIRAYDLATGDLRSEQLDTGGGFYWFGPWQPFAVDDRVVVDDGGDVVLVDVPDLRRTRLARGHVALRTVDDAAVWVLDSDTPGTQTAVRVRLDGTVVSSLRVPPLAIPQVGTADGILASAPGGLYLLSEAGARLILPSGELIAVSDDRIAWLGCDADLICQVRIGTFDDPDQVRVPMDELERPAGLGGSVGRFSPDGRHLAYPVYTTHETDGLVASGVSVVDARFGAEVDRIAATGRTGYNHIPLDWSPDGRWLFMNMGGLNAWDARSHDITRIDERGVPQLGLVAVQG